MSTIFGMAKLSASDYQFANQADQQLLYGAVKDYLAMANQDRLDAFSMFVSGQTEIFKERVQLPMDGFMQKRAKGTRVDQVKRKGSYDVAYPIDDFSDSLGATDVDFAYMVPAEFQAHVDGIMTRAANSYRFEVLRAIFKNTNRTFVDERHGSLTCVPLANTDGTIYPPLPGATAGADNESYFESGYTTANVTDANNPIKTMTDELISRFGRRTGGLPIGITINTAERSALEALTDFVPYTPSAITPGADTDRIGNPGGIPGEIIGYMNSAWISVWDWMPATYMVGTYLGAEAPLIERNDPAGTGLAGGLRLVSTGDVWPLMYQNWQWRFGVATRNRLNGVVMEVAAGGGYTIPTIYQ